MGTRGVITFIDETGCYPVYQHWDCDPSVVPSQILKVFKARLCWPWPRWEADEMAAAYIAANKNGAGNIRMSHGADRHGDLSFSYTVKAMPYEGLQLDWKDDHTGEEAGMIISEEEIMAAWPQHAA